MLECAEKIGAGQWDIILIDHKTDGEKRYTLNTITL